METALLKTIFIVVLALLALFATLAKRGTISIPKGHTLLYVLIFVILAHYFAIQFSVNAENSTRILAWFALALTVSSLSFSIGAEVCLQKIFWFTEKLAVLMVVACILLSVTPGAYHEGAFIGFTTNANVMGSYLALVCVPSLFFMYRNRRSNLGRLTLLALLVITMYLLLLTGSRAAFFAIGGAYYLVYIFSKRLPLSRKLLLCLPLLAAPFALSGLINKYDDATSVFFTRAYLITLRLEAISQSPYWGWGLGADVNNSFDEFNIFPPQEKGNTVLQVLEEFGMIFGTLFLIIYAVALIRAIGKLNRNIDRPEIAIFLIAATAHLMFETWLLNFHSLLSIYFWAVFFAAIAIKKKTRITVDQQRKARRRRRILNALPAGDVPGTVQSAVKPIGQMASASILGPLLPSEPADLPVPYSAPPAT